MAFLYKQCEQWTSQLLSGIDCFSIIVIISIKCSALYRTRHIVLTTDPMSKLFLAYPFPEMAAQESSPTLLLFCDTLKIKIMNN